MQFNCKKKKKNLNIVGPSRTQFVFVDEKKVFSLEIKSKHMPMGGRHACDLFTFFCDTSKLRSQFVLICKKKKKKNLGSKRLISFVLLRSQSSEMH